MWRDRVSCARQDPELRQKTQHLMAQMPLESINSSIVISENASRPAARWKANMTDARNPIALVIIDDNPRSLEYIATALARASSPPQIRKKGWIWFTRIVPR
jgi:hypothetical protein